MYPVWNWEHFLHASCTLWITPSIIKCDRILGTWSGLLRVVGHASQTPSGSPLLMQLILQLLFLKPPSHVIDSSALISQTSNWGRICNRRGGGHSGNWACTKCYHSKRVSHTIDRCRILHGKPTQTANTAHTSNSDIWKLQLWNLFDHHELILGSF